MKNAEDEAFEDIERRQGGGFPAKRAAATDKLQEEDWGALAEKQLASIERDTRASFEDAMVRATHKVMTELEAQPAQEPMRAYIEIFATNIGWEKDSWEGAFEYVQRMCYVQGLEDATTLPLPMQPVQREWVGLTDEDRKAALLPAYKEWECEELLLCAREDYLLIEQALKEKNG